MKLLFGCRFLPLIALGTAAVFASNVAAQDVAITNVQIIVGNGAVIPTGSLIVRGGKIISAATGSVNTEGLKVIDGKGMSAMPGFIDAHKHINPDRMKRNRCSHCWKQATRRSCPAAARAMAT